MEFRLEPCIHCGQREGKHSADNGNCFKNYDDEYGDRELLETVYDQNRIHPPKPVTLPDPFLILPEERIFVEAAFRYAIDTKLQLHGSTPEAFAEVLQAILTRFTTP